ncbi:MAG: ABC transporter permease [Rhodobacter sp.]|jgi:ribose transport system permease protein|nr:ABC transporter permease [Rhodobacter sp.]MCA3492068.1 ABC transporter permease [Rhodobacter sp.]MCA3499180.1 ABC transporter permease [Rhodobacter sp.]MCA3503606.1 ABC transporter permease [Rhodobacter sp.]MCA3505784.1 ABC transporter permease [Rhodobacter sp.]
MAAIRDSALTRAFDNDWIGPGLVSLIAVVAISLAQPAFLSSFNIFVLMSAISVNMVIALGQLVIIGLGQMNLALGSIGGLVAISFVGVIERYGVPVPLALAFALGIGIAAGMSSGYIIARTMISAFIITLAGLQIFKGINLGITEAQPFYGVPEAVKTFGQASVIGPLPWLMVPMMICAFAMWYVFNRMRIGRHILAMGSNPHAAELSGIDPKATIIWAHAISGLLAAIAGLMLVARLQIGQPTIGDDWLISSFAAPVIGGAVLTGGRVSVAGTFFGVVIIAIITQGLVMFNIDPFVVQIVLGALILWAVAVNRLREVRIARVQARGAGA